MAQEVANLPADQKFKRPVRNGAVIINGVAKRGRGRPSKHLSKVNGIAVYRRYVDDWEGANVAERSILDYFNKRSSGIKKAIEKSSATVGQF